MSDSVLDQKVRELFKIISNNKEQISKLEKPNFKTNLSFIIDESNQQNRLNLRVLDVNTLIKILANLTLVKNEYDKICIENNITSIFTHSGYSFDEWQSDILTLINISSIKKKKEDLAIKEAKLNQLISPEERRRLDIEAIEKELNS